MQPSSVECYSDRLEFDLKPQQEADKCNGILFLDFHWWLRGAPSSVSHSVFAPNFLWLVEMGVSCSDFLTLSAESPIRVVVLISPHSIACTLPRWVPTASASVWKTTIIPSDRISEATQSSENWSLQACEPLCGWADKDNHNLVIP